MAFVYWIHLPEHSDITCEGYVGITTMTVDARFKRHVYSAKKYKKGRTQRIIHCMRKYKDQVMVKTLLEGSIEYCQLVENKLRPSENIGWNLAPGGSCARLGCKNTPEHTAKLVAANTGRKHTPEQLAINRENGKKQFTFKNPWDHPYSKKDVWSRADEVYAWYSEHPKDGRRTVAKVLLMPPDSVLHPLKRMKDGWNPYEDQDWLHFKQLYDESQHG